MSRVENLLALCLHVGQVAEGQCSWLQGQRYCILSTRPPNKIDVYPEPFGFYIKFSVRRAFILPSPKYTLMQRGLVLLRLG